jgi:hypothetical protein
MIVLKPRVQAEMLQAVRKHPLRPEDFIATFGKKYDRNAVFRLANVAMVIVGAAGYIRAPKSWLPNGKAQEEGGLSSNDNTIGELRIITKTLIDELNKNSLINKDNNKALNASLKKFNNSNRTAISKAIKSISNKIIYKRIIANQAIQAQQISKLVRQNNNVLGKIADKTSRIKYP